MRVDRNTNFVNVYNQMNSFSNALSSLSGSYSAEIGNASSYINAVSFGDWSDPVQVKYEAFVSDLSAEIDNISSDISGGEFSTLTSTVSDLLTALKNCKDTKTLIDSITKDMSRVPKTITVEKNINWGLSYQGGVRGPDVRKVTQANPAYTALEKSLKKNNSLLDNYIIECNNLFVKLSNIDFLPATSGYEGYAGGDSGSGSGGGGSQGGSTGQETGSGNATNKPSSCTNSIPEGIGVDGYYPDIYIDNNHGVQCTPGHLLSFMTNNYPSNDQNCFHFVYNANDGCYYEVNQALNASMYTPYSSIPAGESPSRYGYNQLSPSEVSKYKVLDR